MKYFYRFRPVVCQHLVGGVSPHHVVYSFVSSRMVGKPGCKIEHVVFVDHDSFALSNKILHLLGQKNFIGHVFVIGEKNVGVSF